MSKKFANSEEQINNNTDLSSPSAKNHNKYRKDKPWDHEGIDHWKVEEWKPDHMKSSLLEESSFATLFPAYREKYLQQIWPLVTTECKKYGIECILDLREGSMTVKTTRKTNDPYIILKARDLIKLLARSVPVQQAIKILQDDIQCDIIKIGGLVTNKERFVKRRQRLVGPDGTTLRALELLTECYILVQGNTVSVMGPWKGLKIVRRIVEDCMLNIHPIYAIKTLMIRRELAKDPTLANENWDRFLPKFKKSNVKHKKESTTSTTTTTTTDANGETTTTTISSNKPAVKKYTPFPPVNHQMPSKVDLALESGEYFLSESAKEEKRKKIKEDEAQTKADVKRKQRESEFIAPEEEWETKSKYKKSSTVTTLSSSADDYDHDDDANEKKQKKEKKNKKRDYDEYNDNDDDDTKHSKKHKKDKKDKDGEVSKEDKKRLKELKAKFINNNDE